ncbi:MAG TPA: chorismate synthase, partial [Vicinamibacterales bacterium]|nr:chorismate synthase [Vicinamibacterales bacterium]
MLRFTTAGESHGSALLCILEGMPAGLPLRAQDIDSELARRQQGYGRGRRMQIEQDTAELISGIRAGETTGSPIGLRIANKDWKNWQDVMDPAPREGDPDPRRRAVTRVRPGHADLTGVLKYDRDDARDILERASARETTARVAAAAICRRFLAEFGIRIGSHVVHLGGIDAVRPDPMPEDINAAADGSQLRTLDANAERAMVEHIDAIKKQGNTLGGIVEVVCTGVPVGLGSHVSWDRKLDGRLAAAVLSIPAVKGMEIGIGFEAARRTGAEVHDEIEMAPGRPLAGNVRRRSNRAGGLEGGMTT